MSRVLELSQLVEQFAAWPGCGQMTHRCVISHDSGHRRGAWAATVIPAIDQHVADAGCAQFAEGDFVVVGRHGAHCTSGQCASGQLSLTRFLSLGRFRTDLHRFSKPQPRTAPVASPRLGPSLRRRHLPVRAGRDRAGSVPPRLPDGAGGVGLQAPRPALLSPPVAVLGQMRNRQHPAFSRVLEQSVEPRRQARNDFGRLA